MFDIESLRELAQIAFDRPIDFIFTGVCVGYMIWLVWFIINDDEVR
tara:strand:- start:2896 stop:3033 length:138 start_codon:yes stop_codon:yes gene_type:complete